MARPQSGMNCQEWRELLARRNRTSKTKRLYEDGQATRQYSWDGMVGTSLHYEETEGSGDWLEVDPRIVPSDEPGWDWEMRKSHWRFLVRNGGWFAAEKRGVGIGFRLQRIAYLNIESKEWQTIRTANYTTPTVEVIEHNNDLLANPLGKLTWLNLFPNVDFEIHVSGDRLHEEIKVSQAARDAMPVPPYPADDTYLVMVYEVDWGQVPGLADDDGDIDYDAEFERQTRLYLKNHEGEILTALPASKAWPEGEPFDENDEPIQVPLRKRFVKVGGQHYLLVGAPILALNALPEGTIIFDPDIDEQVGALEDDGDTDGGGLDNSASAMHVGYFGASGSADQFYRFTGISGLSGATISVAHCELYHFEDSGSPLTKIYAEDAESPTQITDGSDHAGRARTTAGVDHDGTEEDGWHNTPSIVDVIQELADSYDPDVIQMLQDDDGTASGFNYLNIRTYDYSGNAHGAKLHIEYSVGPPAGNPWYAYAQQ